jgi:hypothetical protein
LKRKKGSPRAFTSTGTWRLRSPNAWGRSRTDLALGCRRDVSSWKRIDFSFRAALGVRGVGGRRVGRVFACISAYWSLWALARAIRVVIRVWFCGLLCDEDRRSRAYKVVVTHQHQSILVKVRCAYLIACFQRIHNLGWTL